MPRSVLQSGIEALRAAGAETFFEGVESADDIPFAVPDDEIARLHTGHPRHVVGAEAAFVNCDRQRTAAACALHAEPVNTFHRLLQAPHLFHALNALQERF